MGWKRKDYRDFSVHVYSAGEDGCLANSYIVETASHLLVIDTQYLLPYAEKVKAMAVRLNKPIARVIITHAHPDHWFGTSVFAGEQIYALPIVRMEMEKDAVTAFQRNKPRLGDKIGEEAVLPNHTLEKGRFVVDGVEFYVHEILNTETSSLAVLEIPAEKILFASDMVYAHTYIYVADNHIEEWIAALKSCQQKSFKDIFPGHGNDFSSQVLQEEMNYLRSAGKVIAEAKSFSEFRQRMLALYPDYAGKLLLELNAMFLVLPLGSHLETDA